MHRAMGERGPDRTISLPPALLFRTPQVPSVGMRTEAKRSRSLCSNYTTTWRAPQPVPRWTPGQSIEKHFQTAPVRVPSCRCVCRLGTEGHCTRTQRLTTNRNFNPPSPKNNTGHLFISKYIYMLLRGEGSLFTM